MGITYRMCAVGRSPHLPGNAFWRRRCSSPAVQCLVIYPDGKRTEIWLCQPHLDTLTGGEAIAESA